MENSEDGSSEDESIPDEGNAYAYPKKSNEFDSDNMSKKSTEEQRQNRA